MDPSSPSSNQGCLSLDWSQIIITTPGILYPKAGTATESRTVRSCIVLPTLQSTFTHMSSWDHQTLSSRGKGDTKTCQAEDREGASIPEPGGLGALAPEVLSPQSPPNTSLPTRGTWLGFTHQEQAPVPPIKACMRPWNSLTHEGADSKSKRNYKMAAWEMELDKMRQQWNMVQMKKQDKIPPQTKWSRDRKSAWIRIWSNDSKDDSRSQKKNYYSTGWEDTGNG